MSEHSDESGSGFGHDPELDHDGSSSDPPGSGHEEAGDGLLGPGHSGDADHELGSSGLEHPWHPEDEPPAMGEGPHSGEEAPGTGHERTESLADQAGASAADHNLVAALPPAGATLFDPVAEPEPAWLDGHDSPPSLAEAIDAGHYSSGWAQDDGTGLIGALAAEAGDAPAPESGGDDHSAIFSTPLSVVYGGHAGLDQTAGRLWDELGPGTPAPTDESGAGLPPAEVLTELARHLADPVELSVVAAALNQVRANESER